MRHVYTTIIVAAAGLANPICVLAARHVVTFNHETRSQSHGNLLASSNDEIVLRVVDTNAGCYTYNFSAAAEANDPLADDPPKTIVDTEYTHREDVSRYVVEIKKREVPACMNDPLGDYTFSVNVETLGWTLSTSGAFYLSDLTDPKFYLEPGMNSGGVDGFFIRRNMAAEDSIDRGLAFLVHVYDERKDIENNVLWAPITFGIGFDNSTNYFIGTSWKFGNAMFLTAGVVFGERDELPTALSSGRFTEDANALDTLASRSDNGLFISFSYGFGSDAASSRLSGLFQSTQTEPVTPMAKTTEEAAGEQNTE